MALSQTDRSPLSLKEQERRENRNENDIGLKYQEGKNRDKKGKRKKRIGLHKPILQLV